MASKGPRNPNPPKDFHDRKIRVSRITDTEVYRVSGRGKSGCLFYSRTGRYRFDFEDASFGVCYFGSTKRSAILETLGRYLVRSISIPEEELENLTLYRLAISKATLCPMHGSDLSQMGGTGQVTSGSYTVSRRWAQAIMTHPSTFSGIEYTGRICQELCYALFGKGKKPFLHEKNLKPQPIGRLIDLDETWIELDNHRCGVKRKAKKN